MVAPVLSFRRKLLYTAVLTVGATALFFGVMEAALRLAGYGYSPHFARKVTLPDGGKIWRENRWCTAPYFSPALVRRPQPFRLPEKKSPGTYRIFILGSSAAMGDPEASFSLARMLEAMLQAAYPKQRFEVVNAAVTAINSRLVRGIAADCAQLEPDLFIVYEGHNEVIGPFGPAGVFAPFLRSESAIRLAVWFKGTRTGQLLAAAGRAFSARAATTEWGGMQMFLQQQIAADDPRLTAVRTHFRANLLAIAASARAAGATTLVCTAAANQRDFAPFLSAQGEAEKTYQQARQELQAGHHADARRLFQRALDLDTLRFRADSALNETIRGFTGSGVPGLVVVDTAAALAARSPDGLTGNEFFYEHVHLNLRGTHEIASLLLPRIAEELGRRGLVRHPAPAALSLEEVSLRLGYNTHEQAMIALELLNRFSKPPFTSQSDSAARTATWQRRADAARALLVRPDATDALRELGRRAAEASPDDWILARNTGAMLTVRGAPAEALPLLERAAAWIDDDIDTLVALGRAQLALGQTAAAENTFAKARHLEPRYPGLPAAPGKGR